MDKLLVHHIQPGVEVVVIPRMGLASLLLFHIVLVGLHGRGVDKVHGIILQRRPGRMLVRQLHGDVHVEVIDDFVVVKGRHFLQPPNTVVVDAADDNPVRAVDLSDGLNGPGSQRVPALRCLFNDLVEQLKHDVLAFAFVSARDVPPQIDEPFLLAGVIKQRVLVRRVEGKSGRLMQVNDQVQARLFAPLQAPIQVAEPFLIVPSRSFVVLDQRVIQRDADVIHAPGSDLLNVLLGDKSIEVSFGVPCQISAILRDPAAKIDAGHIPCQCFHLLFPHSVEYGSALFSHLPVPHGLTAQEGAARPFPLARGPLSQDVI